MISPYEELTGTCSSEGLIYRTDLIASQCYTVATIPYCMYLDDARPPCIGRSLRGK